MVKGAYNRFHSIVLWSSFCQGCVLYECSNYCYNVLYILHYCRSYWLLGMSRLQMELEVVIHSISWWLEQCCCLALFCNLFLFFFFFFSSPTTAWDFPLVLQCKVLGVFFCEGEYLEHRPVLCLQRVLLGSWKRWLMLARAAMHEHDAVWNQFCWNSAGQLVYKILRVYKISVIWGYNSTNETCYKN